jgi:hypothetical protein
MTFLAISFVMQPRQSVRDIKQENQSLFQFHLPPNQVFYLPLLPSNFQELDPVTRHEFKFENEKYIFHLASNVAQAAGQRADFS